MKQLTKEITGILVALIVLFYVFFLNHVSLNEVGVFYNSINGKIEIQTQPGWRMTDPWVREINIFTLPIRVELPVFSKTINVKLVRIKPDYVMDLIKHQGFGYGLSLNFNNIIVGYAFLGQNWKFLEEVK